MFNVWGIRWFWKISGRDYKDYNLGGFGHHPFLNLASDLSMCYNCGLVEWDILPNLDRDSTSSLARLGRLTSLMHVGWDHRSEEGGDVWWLVCDRMWW